MSFREAESILNKTTENHKNLEEICNVMNVILENGYFNVITTMCGHVIEFQTKVKKMLLDAQKNKDQINIKPTVQQNKDQINAKKINQQKMSFDMSNSLLKILFKNNTELEEICNVMNVTLENGYFNVVTTMCEHVIEFQYIVKTMLLEAQNKDKPNIKTNVQQKKNQKRSKNKKQNNHKTKKSTNFPIGVQLENQFVPNLENECVSEIEIQSNLEIQSDSNLEIQSDSKIEIQSDSKIEIQFDSKIEIQSDSKIEIQSKYKYSAKEQVFMADWY